MRPIQHPVRLTTEEREQLRVFISKGKGDGSKELEIAERLQAHVNTVYNIRKACADRGCDGAIARQKQLIIQMRGRLEHFRLSICKGLGRYRAIPLHMISTNEP